MKHCKNTIFRHFLMLCAGIVCLSVQALATRYIVPGTYATINEAIDSMNADGAFADTIWITDGGIYLEACDFNNLDSCWMIGAPGTRPLIQYNGTDTVAIASWGGTRALMRHSNYTSQSFSVRNVEICGISEADSTDTLSQLYWGTMNFYNCEIHDATGIIGQQRNGAGGSIYILDSCVFYHSYKGPSTGTGTVSNCVFHSFNRDNGGWENPSGFYVGSNNTTIENCVFFNNGGTDGQVVFIRDASDITWKNNLFYNNNNNLIRLFAGAGELNARHEWINNTIVYNQGGGLWIPGNQNWVIKNNILWGNNKAGGGAYDLYASTDGKKGWDITYNIVGTYDSDLDSTFAETLFCVGNDSVDPQFADTTDSINGFYLFYRSPAIDRGSPGILDPDGSRSDQGCYGGPGAVMKAPKWLASFGGVWQDTLSGLVNDTVWWSQYGEPAGFDGYLVFHDTNTTSNLYNVEDSAQVAKITSITGTELTSKHVDSTWYKVSVYCDSTGDTLGGGFTCMDTVTPFLTGAYYFSYGTGDPSDDELRLIFNEGIQDTGIDMNAPGNYISITGVGDFTGAYISSVNEFIIRMGAAGTPMAHNRTWVKVRTDSLEDFFGNVALTAGDSIEVKTFNVYNTDNGNSYEAIDKAAEFASSGHFITILDDGYYDEEVTVTVSNLTIQADSTANPVVDGDEYCFDIQADDVNIVSITCTSATRAAIRIAAGVSGVEITDDTIYSCAGDTGIAVYGTNNEIRGNVVYGCAIGIHATGDTSVIINNIVRGNTAEGIKVNAATSTVRNNVAYGNGTGIDASGAGTRTTNNVCLGNTTNPVQGTSTELNNTDDGTDPFNDAAGLDFTLDAAASEWSAGENGENIGRYEGRVERSGDGYGTKYHTINAAYQAAGDGETLRLYYGNYYEKLLLVTGRSVNIQPNGTDSVFWRWDQLGVDLGGAPYYMLADTTGQGFTVRGIIFDNGDPNVPDDANSDVDNYSSCIYLEKGTITNCLFRNLRNSRPECGIVIRQEDTVTVDSCTFLKAGIDFAYCNNANLKYITGCYFDSTAWGLDLQNTNRVNLLNNRFIDVTIRFEDGGNHTIKNNLFWRTGVNNQSVDNDYDSPNYWFNNTVYIDDGGVHIEGVGDTLVNNIFFGAGDTAIYVHETSVYAYYNIIDSVPSSDQSMFPSNQGNLIGADFEYPLWSDTSNMDFYLRYNSPAIDRGHSGYFDPDSSRSDIGAYGGIGADTAAPAILDTFVYVTIPGNKDSLHWSYEGGGVPPDFDFYMIYRATIPIFIPSAATKVGSVQVGTKHDTTLDNGGTTYFYRMSVVDTDLYGGGYMAFDTVSPFIDTAMYFSNGTPGYDDDTLKVVMSEWVLDAALPDSFKNIFTLSGMGNGDTAMVYTGSASDDDTLIVTGFSRPLCYGRSWLGLADSVLEDYFENYNVNDSVEVITFNVYGSGTGNTYRTITEAYNVAGAGDSIKVFDAGLYEDTLKVTTAVNFYGYGIDYGSYDSLPVWTCGATAPVSNILIDVNAACSLYHFKFLGSADVDYLIEADQYTDPDMAMVGCILDGQNVTMRGFNGSNSGVSNESDVLIDSCVIRNFTSQGVHNEINHSGGNNILTIQNSQIYHCGMGIYNEASQKFRYLNNIIYDCSDGIQLDDHGANTPAYGRIVGNLIYGCGDGIYANTGDGHLQFNLIAFNTVVQCTSLGIRTNSLIGSPDTVKYNIVWSNGTADLDTATQAGSQRPVADYNFHTVGGIGNWVVGANSDSGYPQFADTLAAGGYDWQLQNSSPCIGFSDWTGDSVTAKGVAATDLAGNARPLPGGTNLDVGCYENTAAVNLDEFNSVRVLRFRNGFMGSALDSFTVMVRLTPDRIRYDSTHNAGGDIRFVDADNITPLPYEFEVWDSGGVSYAWVKVGRIDDSGTSDSIFMYFGYEALTEGYDSTGAWDGNYKAVYHFNNDTLDHSGNGYHATNYGARDTAAVIGDGRYFSQATTDYMELTTSTNFIPVANQPITVEAWFNATSISAADNDDRLVTIYDGTPSSNVILGVGNNDNIQVWLDGSSNIVNLNPTIAAGEWHYAGLVFDSTSDVLTGYIDGVSGGTRGGENIGSASSRIATLGSYDGASAYFNGFMDEIRISNVARSALYFEAQDSSMRDNLFYWGDTLFMDSVTYRSGGTDTTGDDTAIVYMSSYVDYDSLPGSPGAMFSLLGLGSFGSATLAMPGNRDTNLVWILMSNSDTIFCHNRTRLALKDAAVYSAWGAPAVADTDSVITYNVYLPRTGAHYRTLNEANAAIIDDDSIQVWDAGLYAETLAVAERLKLIGYGIDYPGTDSLPVLYDPGNLTDGWRYLLTPLDSRCSTWTFKFVSRTDSVMAVKLSTSGTGLRYYFGNCVFTGSGVARVCMERDWWRSSLTLDSCEVYGYTVYGIYIRHDDFAGNTGQYIYNTTFHDIANIAVWIRDSREMIVNGNTFYDCGPSEGILRFTACYDIEASGNTIYENNGTAGAVQLDWGCYDLSIDNNIIYDNGNTGGGIRLDGCRDGRIYNNLVYNCDYGIILTGSDSTYRMLAAFNTVVQCTSGGISVLSRVGNPDTVKYNIAWSNGGYDLRLGGGGIINDYNWYGPGGLDNWTTGTHTDSGFPLFTDTSGNVYTLQASSPCLGLSDVTATEAAAMGITTDLAGNTRPNPNSYYADAGCYEEQSVLPPWWNSNWQARRVMRIDNGFMDTELDSFTAMVKLYPGRINYSFTQDAGQDIRFIDGNSGTLLKHEIEVWDEAGTSYVWVQIPNIDNGSGAGSAADSIWMYYGNSSAPDVQDTAGTWAGDYVAVWHLNEGSGDHLNATGGLTGTRTGNTDTSGVIGQGQYFDGSDHIDLGDQASLEFGGAADSVTFTAWVNLDGAGSDSRTILSKYYASGNQREYSFGLSSSDDLRISMSEDGTSPLREEWTDVPVTADTWVFVAVTMDFANDDYLLYVDGALQASSDNGEADIATMFTGTSGFDIGAVDYSATTPDLEMVGIIDEVRISGTARTALWIEAQDSSMRDNLFDFGGMAYNGTEPPQVVSAVYRSAGTDTVGDDTLYLTLNFPVVDDSLPTSNYSADSAFSILGLGGMDSATIHTGAIADDEMLIVTFRNGDTIHSCRRTRLVLADSAFYGVNGAYSVQDTDTVVTYNVYNKNLGTSYLTVREAGVNATAGDTIYAFDNGYYIDTLDFNNEITADSLFISSGPDNTPVIKAHDKFMDRTWQGGDLLMISSSVMTWYGFEFDGRYLDGTDSISGNIAFINPGGNLTTLRKCTFHGCGWAGIRSHASDDDLWIIDSCLFYNVGDNAVNWTGDTWASRVTNSVFRDCNNVGLQVSGDSSLVAGNVFYNCGYGISQTFGGNYRMHYYNNLFINNNIGFDAAQGNYKTHYGRIMFNTFFSNTVGLEVCASADSVDTVMYNVFWANGTDMDTLTTTTIPTARPVADYNFYRTGCIGDWVVGTDSDSGYPVFADTNDLDGPDDVWGTADDGLRLQTSSPCIDFTDVDGTLAAALSVATDLIDSTRPSPAVSYADAGCYEEQTAVVMVVDSVKYWSCGTENVADDSMFVWFNHNLEYDSLPGGGTDDATSLFNLIGLGNIGNAVFDTIDGQPDTNYLVIRMNAGDTILSNNRSIMALRADSAWTELGPTAAAADTDSVDTRNVYILRTGAAHRTINTAFSDAAAGDSLLVMDAGFYPEYLNLTKNIAVVGYGYGDSLPVWQDVSAQSRLIYLNSAGACTVANIKLQVRTGGNDFIEFEDADPDLPAYFVNCEFDGTGNGQYIAILGGADANDVTFDSCVIHDFSAGFQLQGSGTQILSNNTMYHCGWEHTYTSAAVYNRGGSGSVLVKKNVFYDIINSGVCVFDNTDDMQVIGNLMFQCKRGVYCPLSNDGRQNRNGVYKFNTVVQCTSVGIQTFSELGSPDTVMYNISWSNGNADFDTLISTVSGTEQRPVADYNYYRTLAEWAPGTHSGSGYPYFQDTTDADGGDGTWRTSDDGFALSDTSPCIGISDVAAAAAAGLGVDYDLIGNARPTPVDENLDLGAYEEQTADAGRKIYISKSGSNSWPYTSPTTASSDAGNAFLAMNAGFGDTVLFYETGVYTEAGPCSITVNGAVVMEQFGQVCTLARDPASTDSAEVIGLERNNIKIYDIAINGGNTASSGVRGRTVNNAGAVLDGLDIFGLIASDDLSYSEVGGINFGENNSQFTITDCKIHDFASGGVMGIQIKDANSSAVQKEITRCQIYNVPSSGIWLRDGSVSNVFVHHNLIYGCDIGISDAGYRDTLIYNTLYGNTTAGIRVDGHATADSFCQVRYNVGWNSGTDFTYLGTDDGFDFDYNCYGSKHADIAAGANDVTDYAEFTDSVAAGGYDFTLQITSPAIDVSDDATGYTDVTGTATPRGPYNDLGCYENPSPLRVDSVYYYSRGTAAWDDDSLLVFFNQNVEYDSLPGEGHGTGLADNMFDLIGLGNISTATVDTPVGMPDTNFIVIQMNGGDTILNRNRSILALTADSAYSVDEAVAIADTDSVATWNVYILRTGGAYQTISGAAAAMSAGDSILIMDAGYYREMVKLPYDNTTMVGYGIDYGGDWITEDSLPVVQAVADAGTLLYIAASCTLVNIKFLGPASGAALSQMCQQSDDDDNYYKRCIWDGNMNTTQWDNYSSHTLEVDLDSCDISRFTTCFLWSRHRDRDMTVSNCRIHDITGNAFFQYPAGYHSQPQNYINNVFYNINGMAVQTRQSALIKFTGNLVYNCDGAYANSNENSRFGAFRFNTVVQCTSTAFYFNTQADADTADTCEYNIVWSNGTDLNHDGNPPTADYNFFTGSNNGANWTAGAHSDSGYPEFTDTGDVDGADDVMCTGDDGYMLLPASRCLDYSGYGGAGTDLAGQTRPMPAGSDWDLGCYEEQSAARLLVDSVKYWSAGTEDWADDSMTVWFSTNLEFDSLDLGAGNADNFFSLSGLGYIANATLDTPVGCPDTNFLHIELNNGDTVLSHNRSRLVLTAGGVYSTAAAPAIADLDSVETWNVYVPGTGSYRTLNEAYAAAGAADSIRVLDIGLYPETLAISFDITIQGSKIGDSLTLWNDPGNLGAGSHTLIYSTESCTIRYFKFDVSEHDSVNFFGNSDAAETDDNYVFKNCELDGHGMYYAFFFNTGNNPASVTIDSCSITDVRRCFFYTRASNPVTISNNYFYNAGGGYWMPFIYYYSNGWNCDITNNRFYRINDQAVSLRGSNGVTITGNLFYECDAGITSYNEDNQNSKIMFNTAVQCTALGIRSDCQAGGEDSVFYNIAWSNGTDFSSTGAGTPYADYNWFSGGNNSNWTVGANSDSGYPVFADTNADDYHLMVHSPCIDRGAGRNDLDGSSADLGCYGGQNPLDTLMPKVLDTLIVKGGTAGNDSVIWSTTAPEGDFAFYAVYRDSVEDFVPAESLCIDSITNQAVAGTMYANDGKSWYYKVSAVDADDYGGGYVYACNPKMQIKKVASAVGTVPGDTVTYTIYYDNDAAVATTDTANIVDYIPEFTMFLDTTGKQLHTGGSMDIDYLVKGGAWRENKPATQESVVAVRWQIVPGIGAHSTTGDPASWDLNKTGVDTNAGDDAGWVRFKVRIR